MNNAVQMSMRVADLFFDDRAVRRVLTKKRRKALSKQGSFIRRDARGLLRNKKPRGANQPPAGGRSKSPNLRTIYFVYEPATKGVIIGPTRLNTPGPAAFAHEHGKAIVITRGKRGKRKRVRAKYPKRPFMGPAQVKATASPGFMGPWEE